MIEDPEAADASATDGPARTQLQRWRASALQHWRASVLAIDETPAARLVLLILAVGLVALVRVLLPGEIGFEHQGLAHVRETAFALLAMFVAAYAFGRFYWRGSPGNLTLAASMSTLAWVVVLLGVAPLTAEDSLTAIPGLGQSLGLALAGVLLLWSTSRPAYGAAPAPTLSVGIGRVLLPGAAIAIGAAGSAVIVDRVAGTSELEVIAQLLEAAVALLFTAAAWRTARSRDKDPFLPWLAAGAAFAASSGAIHAVEPSRTTTFISIADGFLLAALIAFTIGAVWELTSRSRMRAARAVLRERERIVLELRDREIDNADLIQRLIFADEEFSIDAPEPLAVPTAPGPTESTERAGTSASAEPKPLAPSLERAAREVADSSGVDLTVRLDDGIDVLPAIHDTLVSITQDYLGIAVRYRDPETISIDLFQNGQQIHLTLSDDGTGTDGTSWEVIELALARIRTRGERIGAATWVTSGAYGTTVELVLS